MNTFLPILLPFPPPSPPLQVLVVVAIVFSILLYRIAISAVLYVPLVNTAGRAAGAGASIFASITGACVQLVGILIMNFVSVSTHCSGMAAYGDVWGIVTVTVGGDTCCSAVTAVTYTCHCG